MKKQSMPTGFSAFSWAIVAFCLPVLLWPLALLISPNLLKNPQLNDLQMTWMSIFLWVYPFVLGIWARIAYRLQFNHKALAKGLLIVGALLFYASIFYISVCGFSG